MCRKLKQKISGNKVSLTVLNLAAAVGIIFLVFLIVELGCDYDSAKDVLRINPKFLMLNMLIGASFMLLLWTFTGRLWAAELLYAVLMTILSLANHYTIEWHGSPLTLRELKNTGTALDVLHSYSFTVNSHVVYIAVLFAVCVITALLVRWLNCDRKKYGLKGRACLLLVTAASAAAASALYSAVVPAKLMSWLWTEPYHSYGYLTCTISRAMSSDPVEKPEGYDGFDLSSLLSYDAEQPSTDAGGIQPDVILILNESFYDIAQLTEPDADAPYLGRFYSLGHTSGYAVVPSAGGGTNVSEFVLLTGNVSQLFSGATPFNDIRIAGVPSLVSVLESSGRGSLAAHPASINNYSRGRGYLDLGFDNSYFDSDFTGLSSYGHRHYATDESAYENFIRWYEASEKPGFYYLLTIQNHGEYDRSDPEYDTVHAQADFGKYNDHMDEFLTSISISDEAFGKLLEYYSASDRPVVVCMVGDHCPSFAKKLETGLDEETRELNLRKTPFVIWSNYAEGDGDIGTISLNYLAPLLLQKAGVNMPVYYRYMLDMMKDVPILTGYGIYYSADGTRYEYYADGPYRDMVNKYLYMEYNAMDSKGRIEGLFRQMPAA